MLKPLEIRVRYSGGAYNTNRIKGETASSTSDARTAAERLAGKLFGKEEHHVLLIGSEFKGCSTWRVLTRGDKP